MRISILREVHASESKREIDESAYKNAVNTEVLIVKHDESEKQEEANEE